MELEGLILIFFLLILLFIAELPVSILFIAGSIIAVIGLLTLQDLTNED